MKRLFETGMLLFAAMGFWGMIYPDLCFTQDVCEICIDEEECSEDEPADEEGEGFVPDVFTRLCMAEPEQIQVKSRFVEMFKTGKQGKSECHQEKIENGWRRHQSECLIPE